MKSNIFIPCYRCSDLGSGKLGVLPEITRLGSSRAGVRIEPRNQIGDLGCLRSHVLKPSAYAKGKGWRCDVGDIADPLRKKRGTNRAGGRVPETHPGDLGVAKGLPRYIIARVIIIIMTNLLWNESYLQGKHCTGAFHVISVTL